MNQEDQVLFNQKMNDATKNVIAGSNDIFGPNTTQPLELAATRFANAIDNLLNQAPQCTPLIEDTLDHSRESVRQFIKTASQLYGNISLTLESV